MAENRAIISTFYGGERYKSLYYFGCGNAISNVANGYSSFIVNAPAPPRANKTFALYHHKLSPLKSFLKSK